MVFNQLAGNKYSAKSSWDDCASEWKEKTDSKA
jgi:hypothetical protein